MESVSSTLPRAVREQQDSDIDSDYDEYAEYDKTPEHPIPFQRVECGAFDDDDRFCVGWSKDARTPASVVTFNIDQMRLRIRIDHYALEEKVMHLDAVFTDRAQKRVYFAFKHAPQFMRDIVSTDVPSPTKWIEEGEMLFEPEDEDFERLPVFDHKHRQCAQYATIYRVTVCDPSDVDMFFRGTAGRLSCNAKVDEMADAKGNAFDLGAMIKALQNLSFVVAYQAEALLDSSRLLPKDIVKLSPDMRDLQRRIGEQDAASAVRELRSVPIERGPFAKEKRESKSTSIAQMRLHLRDCRANDSRTSSMIKAHHWLVHTVSLTPCFGVRAEGPHLDEGNRILRKYVGFENNFVRASFVDEDGSSIATFRAGYSQCSHEGMLTVRYGDALKSGGLVLGGRKFVFLAYGNSGLREASTWFVRRFTMDGKRITADVIRKDIGDLSELRNPARYAARMGQAFSTSSLAITLDTVIIKVVEDVTTADGKYDFTDGVGTASIEVFDRINEQLQSRKPNCNALTAVQIRLGGAKGMLTLDSRLTGEQVVLRKSMVKFPAFAKGEKEAVMDVCSYWTRPLAFFLNRPVVSLLDSLGAAPRAFLKLQHDVVDSLRNATVEIEEALTLLSYNGLGRAANIQALLRQLSSIGINAIRSVPFLHGANISCVNYALRRIKYGARIPVPQCYTLVGVSDESGWLRPNEIVACIANGTEPVQYLTGECLVTRSPALAPGDVQRAIAVEPPQDSMLRSLRNVVVFSQRGQRPLFTMLSGGDLDGDLYNILQHPDIKVNFTAKPAEYGRPSIKQLDRACTIDDVSDFLLDFLKLNRVGMVATRHLELADAKADGVLSHACVQLAEMHSIAIDFAKTGIMPDYRQLPRASREKPDFMQKEFLIEDLHVGSGCWEKQARRQPRLYHAYYQSEKALGRMFRAIDIHRLTTKWARESFLVQRNDQAREAGEVSEGSWQDVLWDHMVAGGRADGWEAHVKTMAARVQVYNCALAIIAQEHCIEDRSKRLSEEEVFLGHVFRRGVSNSPRLKPYDLSRDLQNAFDVLCCTTRAFVVLGSEKRGGKEGDDVCTRAVWRWLNNDMRHTMLYEHDMVAQLGAHGGGDVDQIDCSLRRRIALQECERLLRFALQRGVAWMRVAMDADEEGRSAPWIMAASVLKAHRCLDQVEKRLAQEMAKEDDG